MYLPQSYVEWMYNMDVHVSKDLYYDIQATKTEI